MSPARFSVRNPVFVNLLLVLILTGGLISWFSANREVFPALDLNLVAVTTPYPRAGALEVEKTVTIPVENAVRGIDGVKDVVSQSLEGRSLVMIEVDRDADTRRVADDVRAELDRLTDLPDDAEDPVVTAIKTVFPVINVAVTGDVPEAVLRSVARELEDALLEIQGVNQVTVTGLRDPRIRIDVLWERALAYGVDLQTIIDTVAGANAALPAGTTRSPSQEWGIQVDAELDRAGKLRDLLVRLPGRTGAVRLGDLARIVEDYEEPVTLSRVNGKPALNLIVFKKKQGDTIRIAREVRGLVEEWRGRLPQGVDLVPNQDNSRWIRKRLETMYTSARLGFALVCLTLFLFLEWRVALWTAAGIPVSFLGAVFLMRVTGISVNMLSLFAFIVVLGMVVDDAIVIAENVYRHMQAGLSPREAAVRGATEVSLPVVAAVTTTVAAFVPMLLMTGTMGKFMAVIPKVVTFALAVSLLEALFILPSHLAHMRAPRPRRRRDGPWFRRLRRAYLRALALAVRYRYVTLVGLVALASAVGWGAARHLRFVLFYGKDLPAFTVDLEAPPGTPLERTAEIAAQVEAIAAGLPPADLDAFTTLVGGQIDPNTGRMKVGENLAQVFFELSEFETPGRRNGFVVADEVRSKLTAVRGAVAEVNKIQAGPPVGKAVDVRVRGEDFGPLRRAAEELVAFLKGLPGVFDVRHDYRTGRTELRVEVDRERAAYYGVSAQAVALALRAAFEGVAAASVRRGEDKLDLVVRLADAESPDRIGDLRIRAADGRLVPLSAVVRTRVAKAVEEINRRGGRRAVRVTADVDNAVTSSSQVASRLREKFRELERRYPGLEFRFGGEQREQAESVASLVRAFLIALVAIYAILGGLFQSAVQPLLIMFAIPFAAVGVLIGHLVLGEPVGLLTLIGLTALTGIVVNDSLVLVDFINRARRSGADRWRSVLRAGRVRLRPVLLTSITTIAGFGNLALKTTGQAAFLAPMAISIVWGLAFATVLTLVVIPALVAVTDDLKRLASRAVAAGRPGSGTS